MFKLFVAMDYADAQTQFIKSEIHMSNARHLLFVIEIFYVLNSIYTIYNK